MASAVSRSSWLADRDERRNALKSSELQLDPPGSGHNVPATGYSTSQGCRSAAKCVQLRRYASLPDCHLRDALVGQHGGHAGAQIALQDDQIAVHRAPAAERLLELAAPRLELGRA
jgi:hypothetical protein